MKRVTRRKALRMLAAEREWRSGSAAMLIDLHRQIDAAMARAEKSAVAERDAKAALARVQAERDSLSAQLERAHVAVGTDAFPLRAVTQTAHLAAVAAEYHGSTFETCSECQRPLIRLHTVHRGGTIGPEGHFPWAVHDHCYDAFIARELESSDVTS